MWLLPALPFVCRAASRVFYRLRLTGEPVPHRGPVLLVANHPNALLDPMLVEAAANRPVRFLAKAPLFDDPMIGWLVRAAGSIPVYRRQDDAAQMDRNQHMFRAVHEALAEGSAVGIFPEGISHGDPSLAPLRTGAARIALGAFQLLGERTFPIVPVGLVLRSKESFRSPAAVIVGPCVEWADLGPRGLHDPWTARELTARIDGALRRVTVNLERWADGPLAECAVRIWETELVQDGRDSPGDPADRVRRLETTTSVLEHVRRADREPWNTVVREVEAHRRRLLRIGLRPGDLGADVSLGRGVRWGVDRLWLAAVPATACALLGSLLFWPAYRVTNRLACALTPDAETLSTYKLLGGIVIYALWLVLLTVLIGRVFGGWPAALAVPVLPLVGMAGLAVRERWRQVLDDVRRFFTLRSRRSLVAALRRRQANLAVRLQELHDAVMADGSRR